MAVERVGPVRVRCRDARLDGMMLVVSVPGRGACGHPGIRERETEQEDDGNEPDHAYILPSGTIVGDAGRATVQWFLVPTSKRGPRTPARRRPGPISFAAPVDARHRLTIIPPREPRPCR